MSPTSEPRHFSNLTNAELEERIREIAREEVASLCGLVLRRLQGVPGASGTANPRFDDLSSIFGEALRDFSATPSEPGPGT